MASPPPPPGGGGPGGPGGPPPGGPGGSVASTSYSTVLFISQVSMMLKESLFYCGLIQLVIILYMYLRVGKGRLWMAFLYSTLCLFSGKVLEHILKSLINFKETSKYSFIFCIPLETFYIASNYTISYINLIKLRALTDRPYVKRVKLLISIVFPFYCTSRYFIGYFRYVDKDFNSERARNCKGLSYTILGCLNIFMTFFIYRELKYNYRKERTQSNYLSKITFYRYVRKSNYAVLILLNLCSFILSFINYSYIKGSYIDLMCIPECIQDNLLFFLAIDTLIYKADYFKMLNSQGATVGGDIHHRHYLNKSSSNGISNSNSKTSLTKSVPIITSYNSNSNSNNKNNNNESSPTKTNSRIVNVNQFENYKIKLNAASILEMYPLPNRISDLIEDGSHRKCKRCNSVPYLQAICLLCGEVLCFQSYCCNKDDHGECYYHSQTCSKGTGMYLLVRKCLVLINCGKKGAFLNAPYLDVHGEPDESYRRGKPQFLSPRRYEELRKMWVQKTIPSYISHFLENKVDYGGWETM